MISITHTALIFCIYLHIFFSYSFSISLISQTFKKRTCKGFVFHFLQRFFTLTEESRPVRSKEHRFTSTLIRSDPTSALNHEEFSSCCRALLQHQTGDTDLTAQCPITEFHHSLKTLSHKDRDTARSRSFISQLSPTNTIIRGNHDTSDQLRNSKNCKLQKHLRN